MGHQTTFHHGGVVPSDYVDVVVGTDLPETTVVIYVGTGGGDVTVTTMKGTSVTFKNVADTQELVGRFAVVTAVTGTVADMLAGFAT